jgi:endonuclease YncB( thermonuclease family)
MKASPGMGGIAVKRICIALALLLVPSLAVAAEVIGTPAFVDADTVIIGRARLSLAAIDAPETDQTCLDAKSDRWTCGIAAREALQERFGGKVWTCRPVARTLFDGTLARCESDGEDVARWMARNGWALASVATIRGYGADEAEARKASAGLWAGAFIAPRDWRRRVAHPMVLGAVTPPPHTRHLLSRSAFGAEPPSPDCAIKANVNRGGVCIFHQPSSRWYAKIKMDDPNKGNRWFCSVSEAKAAGCRETRR